MNIAYLGFDPSLQHVYSALLEHESTRILGIYSAADAAKGFCQENASVPFFDDEQELFKLTSVDLIIVSNEWIQSQPEPLEKLRFFLQDQISLGIDHSVNLSVLECYELQLSAEEHGQEILPLQGLDKNLFDLEISPEPDSLQLNIDVFFSNPTSQDILDQLTRDADFLIGLFGHITHVTALTTGKVTGVDDYDFSNFSVQFVTNKKQILRWSIQSLQTETTKAVYRFHPQGKNEQSWTYFPDRFEIQADVENKPSKIDLPFTIQDHQPAKDEEGQVISPQWNQAVKGMEVREALLKSMIRGRTVELNFDQRSEQQTFKGLMAAWGCGLLLLGVAIMFVLSIFRPAPGYSKYICIGFTIILTFFVAAQSLFFVTSEDK